nr:hypothetical chloroplast RF90 [Naviculales sp.]
MLYLFRLLLLLINIDQETVLNWFGIEDPTNQEIREAIENGYEFNTLNFEPSPNVSITTFHLIIEGLWEKVQDGLTLSDIENVLLFILFIRFIILTLRYNLKTSFYITCIGLVAGYLWYKHLIDLTFTYRSVLLKLPFVHKLGIHAIQVRSLNKRMALTDLRLGENAHWYNPGQVLYYAFAKAIVHVDPKTGLSYYIDPISMIVSKLPESIKSSIIPRYYQVYHRLIPKLFQICSQFWNQLSGIMTYAVITRIGKRYCPYLIRWHWTFLIILGLIEQIFVYFTYRAVYFQNYIIIPRMQGNYIDPSLTFQSNLLSSLIAWTVLTHLGFVIFGLFHAIWGQYFYIPFLVENVELHVGPRPANSIYSGGQTSWQAPEEKEKTINRRFFPKLWYGWFGRGTEDIWLVSKLKQLIRTILKILIKVLKMLMPE